MTTKRNKMTTKAHKTTQKNYKETQHYSFMTPAVMKQGSTGFFLAFNS